VNTLDGYPGGLGQRLEGVEAFRRSVKFAKVMNAGMLVLLDPEIGLKRRSTQAASPGEGRHSLGS